MSDINSKLDKLDGRIDNIDVTLAKQSVILEEHQRRSAANELAVEVLRNEVQQRHKELLDHLNPLLKYADRASFLIQISIAIGGVIGLALTVIELLKAVK